MSASEFHRVRIETDRVTAERLGNLPFAEDPETVFWRDEDSDTARVEHYCGTPEMAAEFARELQTTGLLSASSRVFVEAVPPVDWNEHWKRFFRVERISSRLVVAPSWARYEPAAGECVVVLDPGMSFGTGQHPTTRACLKLIEEAASEGSPRSFLDVGCGSGLLAIAAARLGFAPVVAMDHDPAAAAIAAENAWKNNVADRVRLAVADLADWPLCRSFEVVAANLLADTLIAYADTLAAAAGAPRNRLIVSGILRAQYDDILRAYAARGFSESRRIDEGEWITGCLQRE